MSCASLHFSAVRIDCASNWIVICYFEYDRICNIKLRKGDVVYLPDIWAYWGANVTKVWRFRRCCLLGGKGSNDRCLQQQWKIALCDLRLWKPPLPKLYADDISNQPLTMTTCVCSSSLTICHSPTWGEQIELRKQHGGKESRVQ